LPRFGLRSNIVIVIAKRSTLVRLPCDFLRTARPTTGSGRPIGASLNFKYRAGKPRNISTGASISTQNQRVTGGRGRIRTSVARKERQIYSLLVLATHPPVPEKLICRANCLSQKTLNRKFCARRAKTQNGLVSKDTSPSIFLLRIRSASFPRETFWWSWRRELNPRPSDYKSDALPAELRQRSQTNKE
jgi:hypothetical protein